jgi:sulfate adenylyltransferase subunit 2
MPFLNVDTGHHFPELNEFRDRRAAELGAKLIVRKVEDAIASGIAVPSPGEISRNRLQIPTLLAAIEEFRFDCAIGGARRDEEKARAKERIFSFRTDAGRWDPKDQRPEMWSLYNSRIRRPMLASSDGEGYEHIRAFPLSNWTELDVWNCVAARSLELPSIYFSHRREVVSRGGRLCPVSSLMPAADGELVRQLGVRFRTVGDMTCTAAIESDATTVADVIRETRHASTSERGARLDDTISESAMEDRKREGYF